ncbi:hypothetical protein FF1_031676 [Malus domestica]
MEKPLAGKYYKEKWFGVLVSFFLFFVLLCFDYSTSMLGVYSGVNLLVNKHVRPFYLKDSCFGRYIYIHDDLPTRFNYDLLANCQSLSTGSKALSDQGANTGDNMCPHLVNSGLGPQIGKPGKVLANKSWFITNPYLLEVIFHYKMKTYKCLTNNSNLASAIYVPSYTGLDASRHLWDFDHNVRDASAKDLVNWLTRRPEWKKMWGRDHFFVSGRTSWDFRRPDNGSDWGTNLRFLPGSMNMSMLSVEGSCWRNDLAIPYPTNFHPSNDSEVVQWQNRVKKYKRPHLFSFIGAPRPGMQKSIRGKLINQCQASNNCKFVHCGSPGINCNDPVTVMRVFEKSVYCLQPPGDSHTRRSAFDSLLAGCIPVFFHPATAYTQYLWHLPEKHTKYSVFIPVKEVEDLKEGMIEKTLLRISEERELAMREEVIRLIPKLVYADPRSRLESEDAFDLAVQGVLERIENVRKVIREGKDPSVGFADEDWTKFMFPEAPEEY